MDLERLVLAWRRWDEATSDRQRILELEARLNEAALELGLASSEVRNRVNVIRGAGVQLRHAVAQVFAEHAS